MIRVGERYMLMDPVAAYLPEVEKGTIFTVVAYSIDTGYFENDCFMREEWVKKGVFVKMGLDID